MAVVLLLGFGEGQDFEYPTRGVIENIFLWFFFFFSQSSLGKFHYNWLMDKPLKQKVD